MIRKEKQICLCGPDVRTKELVKNSLQALDVEVLDGQELQSGAYVMAVGEIQGTGSVCLKQMDELLKEMERIQKSDPAAVVYISDSRVYGKSFGPQVSRKEEELGYVCHTSMEEMDRQCMRMAEHLVCRMAKEEALPVKVVRLDIQPDAKELNEMMPYILGVLKDGSPGEVYNVAKPADGYTEEGKDCGPLSWKENRSPLTAMEIRMNTEKVRNYVASKLFE